jgi:hypothetical protein
MGDRAGLMPQQGVQKWVSHYLLGKRFKTSIKPFLLILKMIESAFENKHFLNTHKLTDLITWD